MVRYVFVLIKKFHRSNKAVTVWKQYCNRVSTIISKQCLSKSFWPRTLKLEIWPRHCARTFPLTDFHWRSHIYVNATTFDNNTKIGLVTSCLCACGWNSPDKSSNTVYSDMFTLSLAVIRKWRVLLRNIIASIVIVHSGLVRNRKNSKHRKHMPGQETSYRSLKNLTTCLHLYRSLSEVKFQWKHNGFQHKQHYSLDEKRR